MRVKKGTPQKRVHIISRGQLWATKREDRAKASRIYPTKEGALHEANRLKKRGFVVVVHKRDGSVESFDTSPDRSQC